MRRTLASIAVCAAVLSACGGHDPGAARQAAHPRAEQRHAALLKQERRIERRARALVRPTGYAFIRRYVVQSDPVMGPTLVVKTDLFPKPENEHYATGVCTVLQDPALKPIEYISVEASEGSPLDSCSRDPLG